MKIKENAIKIIKERQRKEKRKGDTRRKYLISLPMDALKCHLLSCPPSFSCSFYCSLLPVILCYLPASYLLLYPPLPGVRRFVSSFISLWVVISFVTANWAAKLNGRRKWRPMTSERTQREEVAGGRQRECKVKKLEFRGDKQQFWIGP